MRGRLIFPFLAEIYRFDQVATDADPDAGGPLDSGFDDTFRETVVHDVGGVRTSARKELTAVQVPAQIEPEMLDRLRLAGGGAELDGLIAIVFHYRDLERLDLVEPGSGKPKFLINDRLSRVLTTRGDLVEELNPYLYAHEVQSRGFGLSGGARNLLLMQFRNREKTAP